MASHTDNGQQNEADGKTDAISPFPYTGRKPNVFFVITLVFFILPALAFIVVMALSDDPRGLLFLFALPPVFQLFGLWVLYHELRNNPIIWNFFWFYLFCMPFSLFSYLITWRIYQNQEVWLVKSNWADWLVYLPLVFIFLLIIPNGLMTYRLIESPDEGTGNEPDSPRPLTHRSTIWHNGILLKGMRESVSTVPYWAFLFFFTMFLINTYLFSFAFAFHNIREIAPSANNPDSLPALYMSEVYDSVIERPSPAPDPENTLAQNENQKMQQYLEGDRTNTTSYIFYFEACSARLEYDARKGEEALLDSVTNNDTREQSFVRLRRLHNTEQLAKMVADIRNLTSGGRRMRLKLDGGANETQPASNCHYPSNYALSEARAYSILADIDQELTDNIWRNIEWRVIARSSEPPNNNVKDLTNVKISSLETRLGNLPPLVKSRLREMDRVNQIVNPAQTPSGGSSAPDSKKLPIKDRKITDNGKQLIYDLETILYNIDQRLGQNNFIEVSNLIARYNEQVDNFNIAPGSAHNRSVQAAATPLKDLSQYQKFELLDYIVYTITGPDYGDVFPRTSYSKFLCVFAVIIQIFFVGALLSTILSLKKTRKNSKPDARSLTPSSPTAQPESEESNAVDKAVGVKPIEGLPASTKSSQLAGFTVQTGRKDQLEFDCQPVGAGTGKAEAAAHKVIDNHPKDNAFPAQAHPSFLEPAPAKAVVLKSTAGQHSAASETGCRIDLLEALDGIKLDPKTEQEWIKIDDVAGTMTVFYSVAENTDTIPREGEISINGAPFKVVQKGTEPEVQIVPINP